PRLSAHERPGRRGRAARARHSHRHGPGAGLLRDRLGGRQLVELDLVGQTSSAAAGPTPGAAEWALDSHAVPQFNGRFNRLQAELERWRAEGFRTRLVAGDERQAEHLRQILREHGLEAAAGAALDGPEPLAIVVGELASGFAIPALGVVVL